ncbi:MAG: protein kinase [Acidobacteriota bacterium]
MAYSAGDRLGPYEILSLLGKGAMGEVFRAHDSRLRRDIAIKTSTQRFNERFEREARAIAALNHPNICTLHDIGPDYLVMELVEGSAPKGPLPLDAALRIAGQIADALEAAHEKGIIHRDLKPANVKVTPAGLVKVLDFGLAKQVQEVVQDGSTLTMGLTQPGTALGTPAYMSPEQAQGKEVDKRADVWAFGVLLYELLAGHRPFQGDSVQATLAGVLAKEPDLGKCPSRVRPLLRACLKKDPNERLSNIGDWRLLLEEEEAARSASPRSYGLVPWAVAAVGVALAAYGLFRSVPNGKPSALVRFTVPIPGGDAASTMFALSPDGTKLAINSAEGGKFRLSVRPLDEIDTRLLPGTDGARWPFWSPDGKQIAFFAEGKLKTILASGGEPIVVTDVEPTVIGGTWSREGVIVFSQSRALYKVDERGGKPELLYPANSKVLQNPEFLPDGRHLLFLSIGEGTQIGSIDGAPSVRILQDLSRATYSPDGYLLFTRQSRLTAQAFDAETQTLTGSAIPITRETVRNNSGSPTLSAGEGGSVAYQTLGLEQFAWVDRTGIVRERVGSPQNWSSFRLSSDQTSVAFDVASVQGSETTFDVSILDLKRGTQERLTSNGKAQVPVFSPTDARQVAFSSRRTGRFNPYVADGSGNERLAADLGTSGGYPTDWSPDGKYLLWWGDEDLWIVPVDGKSKPYPFAQSRFGEFDGSFSPDGNWIAYASNETGRYEVYLQRFPSDGKRFTVSSEGGRTPSWRHDGKELYYLASDGRLTAVPITIQGSDVQFGKPNSLFPVNPRYFRAYEPSLDGQRFLVSVPTSSTDASVTMLLHWPQLLSK